MNILEALRVFDISEEWQAKDLPSYYKTLIKRYHPDVNSEGEEMSKLVNCAYDILRPEWQKSKSFGMDAMKWSWWKSETSNESDYMEKLQNAMQFCRTLEGVETEIIGSWIWLSGETKARKEQIKAFSDIDSNRFKWHFVKKCWYYRPTDFKSKKGRGKSSFEEIRAKYGSTIYTAPTQSRVKHI